MGLVITGSAGQATKPIFDAWESFNGFSTPTNNEASMNMDQRSETGLFIGGTTLQYLTTVTGAPGATVQYEATIGRIAQTWPSQIGVSGYSASGATKFNVPFYNRYALAASVPISMLPPLWRYRCDFTQRVTVAGATEFAVAIAGDASAVVAGNNPFVAWSYRGGVNGGRWTPRIRLVTAGGITDGPDSGVAATAWHKLSLMYTPGLVPRIDFLIDDVVKHSLVGDAALPSAIAGAFKIFPGKNMGAGAGTTVQAIESRFTIDELG